MPRTSRGIHRLIGARQSRTIPKGTPCDLCRKHGLDTPATHRIWGALQGGFVCAVHAERGQKLGYEVVEGEIR